MTPPYRARDLRLSGSEALQVHLSLADGAYKHIARTPLIDRGLRVHEELGEVDHLGKWRGSLGERLAQLFHLIGDALIAEPMAAW